MEFHENTSTSDLDETKVDFTETHLQNCNMSEENEKLKVKSPKMLEKETQTSSVWQEIEDANKVLQQEKTAWEEEKKTLYQKIAEASDTKSCNEERDTIHKEAENANQQSDSNKIETYTRENELRDQLEEMELLQRFDKLLLEQQNLELEALRKRVNELEKLQQLEWELDGRVEEEEGVRSDPDRLSLRRRIIRNFIPGWRRRHSSVETVLFMEDGEQPRVEAQNRPSLRERLVTFCSWLFRRRRGVWRPPQSYD